MSVEDLCKDTVRELHPRRKVLTSLVMSDTLITATSAPWGIMIHRLHAYFILVNLSSYNHSDTKKTRRIGDINQVYSTVCFHYFDLYYHSNLIFWQTDRPDQPNASPLLFYVSTTATSLTLTPQSPLRLTGWSHPLIGHWGGRRAVWQRSQRSLGQVRCSACGFQRRSLSARLVCCFPRGDRGSGDLWLRCLKITRCCCMYPTEKHTIRLLKYSKGSTFILLWFEVNSR